MKQIRFSIIALLSLIMLSTSCKKKCDMPAVVTVDAGVDQTITLPVDSVTLTGTVKTGLTPILLICGQRSRGLQYYRWI